MAVTIIYAAFKSHVAYLMADRSDEWQSKHRETVRHKENIDHWKVNKSTLNKVNGRGDSVEKREIVN